MFQTKIAFDKPKCLIEEIEGNFFKYHSILKIIVRAWKNALGRLDLIWMGPYSCGALI